MTFVSLSFVAFLFVGIALFYICPVKYRWLVLLGLSVWFYAQSNIAYLPYILLSTLSIYLAGVVSGEMILMIILGNSVEGTVALLMTLISGIPFAALYTYLYRKNFIKKYLSQNKS